MPTQLITLPVPLRTVAHGAVCTLVPAGAYTVPASLYPTLLITLSGQIVLRHGLSPQTLPPFAVCGGTHTPRRAWAAAGTRIVLITLRHGQWPRWFGDSAAALMDCWCDGYALLPTTHHGCLNDCCGHLPKQPNLALTRLFDILAWSANRHQHRRADMVLPESLWWADKAALCRYFHLSERQIARRFQAAYGQSLRHHRRQLRSSRVIRHLLCSPPHHTESLAQTALCYGFYDQAHLQHDVHHFCAQTPKALQQAAHSTHSAWWAWRLAAQHGHSLFTVQGF